jgi:hypothetical protein
MKKRGWRRSINARSGSALFPVDFITGQPPSHRMYEGITVVRDGLLPPLLGPYSTA